MGVRPSSIPPETRDPDTRRVLDGVRRIVRVLRESSRGAQKSLGLSAAQLFALQQLAGRAPMSLGQLAARTMTHESSISVVIRRLVERGFVSRTRSTADARQLELALTPEGRALLKKAPAAATSRLIEGLQKLPGPVRKQLAQNLAELCESMGISDHEPGMLFDDEEPEVDVP
jgi:DNA-binding MarR family transcriptional regulator